MSFIVVGVGEYYVSNKSDDLIKTFALGSCVAVIAYDKEKKIAGLIHIALPDSKKSQKNKEYPPGYYADTGIPILFKEMGKLGATRENTSIKIAGGSNVLNNMDKFDIGKKNVLAIKKILWKNQLGVIAEDTGGNIPRTISFYVESGEIEISSNSKKWKL